MESKDERSKKRLLKFADYYRLLMLLLLLL